MIRSTILFALLASTTAQAGSPLEDQAMTMLKNYATSKGFDYQLANRCGASQESLSKMESTFIRDVKGSSTDVDMVMRFYENGKKAGDKAFKKLGKSALESETCKQAIEAAQCKDSIMC